jgi:hypothetical protein
MQPSIRENNFQNRLSNLISAPISITVGCMELKGDRRDRKERAKRERIPKHGGSLAATYKNAIEKRLKEKKNEKRRT